MLCISNIKLAYPVGEEELTVVVAVEAIRCSCDKTLAYERGDLNREIDGEARGECRWGRVGREG